MKALLDWIFLVTLGLFATCSTRNAERMSSHPNPVPRAIWQPPLDDNNRLTPHVSIQGDPAWWLEALKLRPHVVRAAKQLAVAAVAARSFQRAVILASTLPIVEPLSEQSMTPGCDKPGNDE
jgi:hypothetical protein